MQNEITLGDLVREMAKEAFKKEDGVVEVPLIYVLARIKGVDCSSYQSISSGLSPDEMANPKLYMQQLKSSYITNTTARLSEMKDNDLKVRSKFFSDDNGRPHIRISLAKGAIKLGSRGKSKKVVNREIENSIKEELSSVLKELKSSQPSLIGKTEDLAAILEGMAMMLEHADRIISERIKLIEVK